MSNTFAELKSDYERLFATMTVRLERTGTVDRIARKLLGHKAQYQTVSAKTGVLWFVIAALHNRESDADFATYFGNGERLMAVTYSLMRGTAHVTSPSPGRRAPLHGSAQREPLHVLLLRGEDEPAPN